MKKIISLLLVLLISVAVLCGCNNQQTAEDEVTETTTDPQNIPAANDPLWYDFATYEARNVVKNPEKLSFPELDNSCETYKFTYFSDRYEVKGFISIPLECINTKTPFDCIVYNRDGIGNTNLLTGKEIATLCDATDRIVIASQYRGADGGQGVDEFGGKDIEDVTTLIDMCEQDFKFAKIDNLCMIGVSRGGMMSYMVAKEDKRVKGIVSVSGISDLAVTYNENADMRGVLEAAIGGTPETHPEEYAKRSAITFAGELTLPVYILHNGDDARVSQAQDIALNDVLAASKYPCTYYYVAGGEQIIMQEVADAVSVVC